ncbi:COMM domain-containing protein 5 isoform X2 [Polypterus senegalus]|uniref:COMM domain-containing protein 5 isoform X2 n=1 Tax=Polypterus senegalus TaxID=55291 RepID=UPI001965E150|nr:COMM domain-containing protein 5 isoform X2 [Polypterus senegalus]
MAGAGKTAAVPPSVVHDRSNFLGARIPTEVDALPKHLQDLDKEAFRKLLRAVVKALEGEDSRESVRKIAESGVVPEERMSYIIAGMYTLLKEALRLPLSSLKQEVFKEDLRDLRRAELEAAAALERPQLPSIVDFKWRVDVTISTSSLARALQPSILMQMKLSDGTAYRFEVPVSKFQELRYNVALILKEMNDLEKRSVLKIQD